MEDAPLRKGFEQGHIYICECRKRRATPGASAMVKSVCNFKPAHDARRPRFKNAPSSSQTAHARTGGLNCVKFT
jgi:hypothetical protein